MLSRERILAEGKNMALIKSKKDSRIMVFIDVRNVINASREECKSACKIDFIEMTNRLTEHRDLVAAYVFDGMGVYGSPSFEKFHDCLEFAGFRVITTDSYETDYREQKGVDVAMASEMLVQAFNDNFDVAIVVSGDGDFVPAIKHVQRMGKIVEVASFTASANRSIRKVADRYHCLSTLPILYLEDYNIPTDGEANLSMESTEDVATEAD